MADNNKQISSESICLTNGSSYNSLSENDINEIIEQYHEEEEMNFEMSNDTKSGKRVRSDTEEETDTEWRVQRKGKKMKEQDKIELYISWNEQLPKQFALAKLFKQEDIKDIIKVKYINQFKVRVEFSNELSAIKFEQCKTFIEKGWRIHRAMEKSYSYGVIKDVDMDISEAEILKSITCPNDIQLVSALRLNRRNRIKDSDERWLQSEAVRLCFKGTNIPAYIYVDELRIKVDPYIFPVTQCTRCWKFGHSVKTCSSKIVCPKCGDNHENCVTENFKCVNCKGKHMAMTKICPGFLKEKRIRELMAEFNCTYRRALTMYVPPVRPTMSVMKEKEPDDVDIQTVSNTQQNFQPDYRSTLSFADVVKSKATVEIHKEESPKYIAKSSKKPVKSEIPEFNFQAESPVNNQKPVNPPKDTTKEEKHREIHFHELLFRLKEILFLKSDSYQTKFFRMIKCCVEWVILVVADNIADWPIVKNLFEFVNG